MTIQKAKKLIQEVESKLMKVEYNVGTFKGVKNLSVADLESIVVLCQVYIKNDGEGFNLVKPYGEVKEVLDKCGITEN